LEKRDQSDLHRRPIFTNDRTELHNADGTANAGGYARQSATEEDVSASGEGCDQAGH